MKINLTKIYHTVAFVTNSNENLWMCYDSVLSKLFADKNNPLYSKCNKLLYFLIHKLGLLYFFHQNFDQAWQKSRYIL